jgi:NAD(P)-dependent dehydrogenase (short-subunit alcohol dehydrogenase family)
MSFVPTLHSGVNFVQTLRHDIYPAIDPTKSDLSQPGKVILVTGSGRGIGRSIAMRFAECHVAAIYLCARTSSELDESEKKIKAVNNDVRVYKLPLDVSNESSILGVAAVIAKVEGRLDVLVNNAGFSPKLSSIIDSDTEEYWNTFVVNLKGPYMMIKNCLPLMLETAKSTGKVVDIVNVASVGANMVKTGPTAYLQTKFALTRLTEFVSVENGDKGVNCISLAPGVVRTKLNENNPELKTSKKELSSDTNVIQMGYTDSVIVDTLELPGGFVAWLTKGERTWLNGRYVSVTWDVDDLQAKRKEIVEGDLLKMRMMI